jgi:hypothetical protein
LRERRGRLLAAVLGGEAPKLEEDAEAARSLLADGLVRRRGRRLAAP